MRPDAAPTRAPATRDQADAYRFGLRRLESALVRGDAVPLHEQVRAQRRAALAGVVLGALAAAVVAWQAGRLIGRGAYQQWQQTSGQAATYAAPPDVHAYAVLLVPAFAAVIALTLMAGWSNDPDLDEPGAQPGYGRDLGDEEARRFSSDWPGGPDPTAAPAPPGPGPAGPPRG